LQIEKGTKAVADRKRGGNRVQTQKHRTPHIHLMLCWFPAEQPGVCCGVKHRGQSEKEGNCREKGKAAGKSC